MLSAIEFGKLSKTPSRTYVKTPPKRTCRNLRPVDKILMQRLNLKEKAMKRFKLFHTDDYHIMRISFREEKLGPKGEIKELSISKRIEILLMSNEGSYYTLLEIAREVKFYIIFKNELLEFQRELKRTVKECPYIISRSKMDVKYYGWCGSDGETTIKCEDKSTVGIC